MQVPVGPCTAWGSAAGQCMGLGPALWRVLVRQEAPWEEAPGWLQGFYFSKSLYTAVLCPGVSEGKGRAECDVPWVSRLGDAYSLAAHMSPVPIQGPAGLPPLHSWGSPCPLLLASGADIQLWAQGSTLPSRVPCTVLLSKHPQLAGACLEHPGRASDQLTPSPS